jgi:hypothetical protein
MTNINLKTCPATAHQEIKLDEKQLNLSARYSILAKELAFGVIVIIFGGVFDGDFSCKPHKIQNKRIVNDVTDNRPYSVHRTKCPTLLRRHKIKYLANYVIKSSFWVGTPSNVFNAPTMIVYRSGVLTLGFSSICLC